jgi:WD40 repeat protein
MLWLALPAAAQELKLVPQTVGLGAFDVAGWTPDGRWLLTASGYERRLRIWDPLSGAIVDSLRLPLPGKRADETLSMYGLMVSRDGRQATVEAMLTADNDAIGDPLYEPIIYSVDLVSRRVSIVPGSFDPNDPSRSVPLEGEVDDVDAGLPALPAAPDGRRVLRLRENRASIVDAQGKPIAELAGERAAETDWVSLSPDGTFVVFLSKGKAAPDEAEAATADPAQRADAPSAEGAPPAAEGEAGKRRTTRLSIFRIETSAFDEPEDLPGALSRVGWLGDDLMILSEASSPFARDKRYHPDAKGPPSDGYLYSMVDADRDGPVPARCYLQALGKDRLVGASVAACRHGVPAGQGIWVREIDGEWTLLPVELPRGATIDGLRASPDGSRIAISIGRKGEARGIRLIDSRTGETIAEGRYSGPMLTAFDFLPDGTSLVVLANRYAEVWNVEDGSFKELPVSDSDPSMIVSAGGVLLFGGNMSPSLQRVDLARNEAKPPLEILAPISGGVMPGRPIIWVANADGELALLDRDSQDLLATMRRFRDGDVEYFLISDTRGRYDSDFEPDYAPIRWLVADAPFQSLSPQTFMRELYTPDLLGRLLACWPGRNCDKALPVALDVGGLNRTLPEVVSIDVTAGAAPGKVDVKVAVKEGVNDLPSAAYYRARSGMHNLRLFRNGVLVAEAGAVDPSIDPADKAGWRVATKLAANRADGTHIAVFEGIRVPSAALASNQPIRFSAYAFNEDRVRGEELESLYKTTAGVKLAQALASARPRRLFLVSIGVDAYPGGLFRPLRYAVADAKAMGTMFRGAFINPPEERALEVIEIRVAGTAARPATRAMIAEAFAKLREATPDDMVVVSFSGHGYTDATGRFSLVPSDVRTRGDQPVRESMIGADDLARWLMPVDAGAIHLVIDACHSAASVQSGGFKPGPMGDPGLGQLAYDKGIRILSASAPDQYAMEDTALGHGLLTYALVEEGAREAKADEDEDGVITFDELMTYAVARLPEMGDPTDPGDGPGLVVEWDGPPTPKQTPKLFDFAEDWSPLAVRNIPAEILRALEKVKAARARNSP